MRRYEHPGKFEGCLLIDLIANELSYESTDRHSAEYVGSSATFVEGPFHDCFGVWNHQGVFKAFDDEELTFLRRQQAAVVYESSDGFVSVDWFESIDEAREHFDKIAGEYTSGEDEEDLDAGEDDID